MMLIRFPVTVLAGIALLALVSAGQAADAPDASKTQNGWARGKTIRFFVGGDAGDTFASVVYRGALQAEKDMGVKVEYVFSGWSIEKMVAQFREAVAAKPDGIAMMGHAGDAALMPIAQQAHDAGIKLMWQNADVPKIRAKLGGGYVGVLDLHQQGVDLAKEAIRTLNLPARSTAIIYGAFGEPGREQREQGVADGFGAGGFKTVCIKALPPWAADPSLASASVTAAILANPEVSVICFPGGQLLGAAPNYLRAANKQPGQIKVIGFDLSPEVIRAFKLGYVQLTSDQQPFLQGYLPVLSLCQQIQFDLSPLVVDTGKGFVNRENYDKVARLAQLGVR